MRTYYFMFSYSGYCYKRNEIAYSYIIEAFKEFVNQNLDKFNCNKMLVNIITKERWQN